MTQPPENCTSAIKPAEKHPLKIRLAVTSDNSDLCSLLNEIIEIGGTTAFQKPLQHDGIEHHFINGPECLCCLVAETTNAEIAGFQALSIHPALEKSWADIATFARITPKTPGTGTALFKQTIVQAQHHKIATINATIRADNISGLAYYSKMGFQEYSVNAAVPLLDGTPVDRISKRFEVPSDNRISR